MTLGELKQQEAEAWKIYCDLKEKLEPFEKRWHEIYKQVQREQLKAELLAEMEAK